MTTTVQSVGPGVSAMLVDNQESFRFTPSGIILPAVNGAGLWANRNKFHNPCGLVNQRAVPNVLLTAAHYLADRWFGQASGGATGKVTLSFVDDGAVSQVSSRSIYLQCTTAFPTLAVGDFVCYNQCLEVIDMLDLRWGTAQARPITVRFRYSVNKAQVVSLSVRNEPGSRSYVTPISLPAGIGTASVLIPGDTAGTWPTAPSSAIGLRFALMLAAPSNGTYTTPNANVWQGANLLAHSSQTNLCAVLNDYVGVADWEMAIGNTPSLYPELRPYEQELAICQRYLPFFAHAGTAGAEDICTGMTISSSTAYGIYPFTVEPRVPPTGMARGNISSFQYTTVALLTTLTDMTMYRAGKKAVLLSLVFASNGSFGMHQPGILVANPGAILYFTGAEI